MQKSDLEHIIRAAAAITNEYEVIVVGSQSILGSVDFPPKECLQSKEADIIIPGNEKLSDLIDGAIGEGSPFEDSFGYYAQGVDSTTCTLPDGWKDRLVRLQSTNTDGRIGYCLEIHDLFLAKCFANREKDIDYNLALIRNDIVSINIIKDRIDLMPISEDHKQKIRMSVLRLSLKSFNKNEINTISQEINNSINREIPRN